MFNKTCLAFFQISPSHFDGIGLHSVWGRIPATVVALEMFPSARHLLYVDSDAILAMPRTPTDMFHTLKRDAYGLNATRAVSNPSLIISKPFTGLLCRKCNKYGLGKGCFNSGVLLWRRLAGTNMILCK